MTTQTVSEWVVNQLIIWGVRSVYGVPGDAILPLVDSLNQNPKIMFYSVKHEATAAMMASAEAKLTGRLSVCTATSGPGVANLINGLADAKSDRVPVLAITGQVDSFNLTTDYKQYIDEDVLLKPVVAYSGLVTTPEAVDDVLLKAMRLAISQGTTVSVAIAKDIWSQPTTDPFRQYEPYLTTSPLSSPFVIENAAKLMNEAERPAILAGRGIGPNGWHLAELAHQWQSGICLTMPAKGRINGDNPLVLGGLGEGGSEASTTMLAEADLILVAGATWAPPKYLPGSPRIIQLDIEPGNIGRLMPVEYGVVGDLAVILPELTRNIVLKNRRTWTDRLKSLRNDWGKRLIAEYSQPNPENAPVQPAFLINTVEKVIAPDAIIALDVGDHTVWFNRIFKGTNQKLLISGNWRTMGFGLPAALSAKIAQPEKQVVALVGDGGLAQSLADFLTAVRYRLPVTVIVFHNGYLAMEKDKMQTKGMNGEQLTITNPDFAGFADICGGKGFRVETAQSLESILTEAVFSNVPAIVDVKTEAVPFPGIINTKQS